MSLFEDIDPNAKNINLANHGLTSIQGIERFTNVRKLNLRGNQIKSLKPLKSLYRLKKLNIRNNQIKSIEPISDLPLERLFLKGNDIADLKLLEGKFDSIKEKDFEVGMPRPIFQVKSGIYDEPFELRIEAEKGHDIYYTLDGSLPTQESYKYKDPIIISEELILNMPVISNYKTTPLREKFSFNAENVKKAITVTAVSFINGIFSEPNYSTYILKPNKNLPTVSLIMNPKDLFNEQEGIPGQAIIP